MLMKERREEKVNKQGREEGRKGTSVPLMRHDQGEQVGRG